MSAKIFLNFSVRMRKNHIFRDSSIERTVQISFAQSQKISLKKAKLSFKKRWDRIEKNLNNLISNRNHLKSNLWSMNMIKLWSPFEIIASVHMLYVFRLAGTIIVTVFRNETDLERRKTSHFRFDQVIWSSEQNRFIILIITL